MEKPTHPFLNSYLQQMTDKQRKALEIARDHLKTSFHMEKSNGFREWKKKQAS